MKLCLGKKYKQQQQEQKVRKKKKKRITYTIKEQLNTVIRYHGEFKKRKRKKDVLSKRKQREDEGDGRRNVS